MGFLTFFSINFFFFPFLKQIIIPTCTIPKRKKATTRTTHAYLLFQCLYFSSSSLFFLFLFLSPLPPLNNVLLCPGPRVFSNENYIPKTTKKKNKQIVLCVDTTLPM